MFLTTALAFATVIFQEPQAQDQGPAKLENPVHAAFKKSLTTYREAAALHMVGSLEIHVNPAAFGSEEAELMKIGTLTSTVKWAKPHYGSLGVKGTIDFMGFEQKIDVESMGLKDGVYILDHDAKIIDGPHPVEDVSDPAIDLEPFRSFMMGKTEVPEGLTQLDTKEGMSGWSWTTIEGQVECWMKGGIPVSMKIEMKDGDTVMQRMQFSFAKVDLLKEVEAETYLGKLPEGYESFTEEMVESEAGDINDGLLSIGSEAPNVTFTDMNDQEVNLESLEGKTVLMNFWFYH
ncbi:MAG: hypothetical protein MK209_01620 [Planctomycetes bacterium]|nr:hypothetical protein [Planctomycetota bacterium]